LTDDPAPDCEGGEAEAAVDPRAPPSVRWTRGCDGLPKIAGACDKPGSRMGVMLFLGTAQERSISSPFLALSLFECFAQFLSFSRRHRRCRQRAVHWSRQSRARRHHRGRPVVYAGGATWKGTSARVAGEVLTRGASTVGAGEGAEAAAASI